MTECRQTNRRSHVVRKAEESGSKRPYPAMVGHAVHDASHGMLSHAEVDIATRSALAIERARTLQRGLGRARKIGIASHQLRQTRSDGVEDLAGGHARRHFLFRIEPRQILVPSLRKLSRHPALPI